MTHEHFTLHQVAGGVWAAQADFTGAAIGNAAIIDVGDKTIVVDTFWTDVAAEELRRTAEELTGRSVHLAVNSHWHGDHTNGNQVFGDIPLVSTRETMDMIAASAPDDLDVWREQLDAGLAQLEQAVEDGDEGAAARLSQQRHFRTFAGNFSLTLPDVLIESRLDVAGQQAAVIATGGCGHTVSDVYVWIPDARVLITGDLSWNGIHPRTNDGFPKEWAAYVETLMALEPTTVIPGHGPPGGSETLQGLPDYFRALPALVEAVAGGANPNDIDPPGASKGWSGVERFRAGLTALAER